MISNELYTHLANRLEKTPRTVRNWKYKGLPSKIKKSLAAKGKVHMYSTSGMTQYFLTIDRKEFEITAKLAAEITTWQQLTASVELANRKLRAMNKRASLRGKPKA